MMRRWLAADSPYVFLGTSGHDDLLLQTRDTPGAETSSNLWSLTAPLEVWIQLSREGETIYAFAQIDGIAWHLVATVPAPFGEPIYFGMAVASEDPRSLALPTFSGVIAAP